MSAFTLLLTLFSLAASSVAEIPNPRSHGAWVTDHANVIDAEAEARMNALIDALEKKLTVEVAVVTVQNVPGTPKEFATELFNHWRIGKADSHNGLLVLMVIGQRRLEMETGYGLEALLPDGWLGQMQQLVMVPAFKRGDYGAGLEAGLGQIVARLSASPEEARTGTPVPVADLEAPERRSPDGLLGAGIGGLAALGAVGAGLAARQRHKRARTCQNCHQPMTKLDEAADDAHLDAGQRTEESLDSVNYDVYRCATCEITKVFRSNRWFSSFSSCNSCGYRTMSSRETVMIPASTISTGVMRIHLNCVQCGFSSTFDRLIPRIPETTHSSSSSSSGSSSSSSGGSFGGGRSGGGGAGSSW